MGRALAVLVAAGTVACGGGGGPGATPGADGGADSGADATHDATPDAPHEGATEAAVDAPSESGPGDGGGDGAAGSDGGDAGGATQAIGIPMYMNPSASPADWAQATTAAPTVALLVANPNSGPGAAAEAQYTQAIAAAHAAHQTIVGYVHTSYGARPIAQVEADVDSWYAFYPAIDGIFFDEASADATTIPGYYQPIHDHVKGEAAGPRTVVINPGTIVPEAFMQAADVVVTFEDTYAHYTDGTYPPNPASMAGYSKWRFWNLVLSAATATDMQNAVTIARQRNAGYVYVTDQPPATAYSQLVTGTYWQSELAAVKAP